MDSAAASPHASTSAAPPSTLPPAEAPRKKERQKRSGPQLLADELIAESEREKSAKTGRLLSEDQDLWTHNAWDHVGWDEEQEILAREAVQKQADNPVSEELRELYNGNPASYWDEFYANVKDNFFKDRAWLCTEFPELVDAIKPDAGPRRIVEIGCGPGNTLFPLFQLNLNPLLKLHGFDFSHEAIDLVRNNPAFDPAFIDAQVWDLADQNGLPNGVEEASVDVAVMIFVMSALHPDEWERAVRNTWRMLKPGGVLLFRDYGRNDMAQLRFKNGRYMQPGLYIRGDHTRVYFFERDELVALFGPPATSTTTPQTSETSADLPALEQLSLSPPAPAPDKELSPISPATSAPFQFELLQLGVDRRLLLNRKKQLKMYRIWLQGRWRKPFTAVKIEALK